MPIRFSTEAANADVLGEDPQTSEASEGAPRAEGAGRTAADRFARPSKGERKTDETPDADVKPGKDINAAGFVKDKDSSKP
jgi:hypothetical protein